MYEPRKPVTVVVPDTDEFIGDECCNPSRDGGARHDCEANDVSLPHDDLALAAVIQSIESETGDQSGSNPRWRTPVGSE